MKLEDCSGVEHWLLLQRTGGQRQVDPMAHWPTSPAKVSHPSPAGNLSQVRQMAYEA